MKDTCVVMSLVAFLGLCGLAQGTLIEPGAELSRAVVQVARTSKTAIGFESRDSVPLVSIAAPFDPNGVAADRALEALLSKTNAYAVTTAKIVIVRPVTPQGTPIKSFLDLPADPVPLKDVTLREALNQIGHMLMPQIPVRPVAPAFPPGRKNPSPLSERRFTVKDMPSSIRELLTDVVVAHGSAGWLVTYKKSGADPFIGFYTFDGAQMSSNVSRELLELRNK